MDSASLRCLMKPYSPGFGTYLKGIMATICGYQTLERNPKRSRAFVRKKRPFLILVWVFLQEEGGQGKRELKRVIVCGFQRLGTSF